MIQRIEGGFYDTVMMSGATKFTYWTAHYLKDVATYMTFGFVNFAIMKSFAAPFDGFLVIFTLFALTQPVYVYSIVYFFSSICNKKGNLAHIILIALGVTGLATANLVNGMRI